jgi:hypothetical protein
MWMYIYLLKVLLSILLEIYPEVEWHHDLDAAILSSSWLQGSLLLSNSKSRFLSERPHQNVKLVSHNQTTQTTDILDLYSILLFNYADFTFYFIYFSILNKKIILDLLKSVRTKSQWASRLSLKTVNLKEIQNMNAGEWIFYNNELLWIYLKIFCVVWSWE